MKATAVAHPNIALIKYWGRRDDARNLPLTGSISITLDGLDTRTTVLFDDGLEGDELVLDGAPATDVARARVARHLKALREDARVDAGLHARVVSENSFPASAGLASSASAFSALTVAAYGALGIERTPRELSAIARLGSGSACRSILGGFVEWERGDDDAGSAARQVATADHWDLRDVVLLLHRGEKRVGSTEGHSLARTSPLLQGRLDYVADALPAMRRAILDRDAEVVGELAERDALAMHAVMMTSDPSLLYWEAATLEALHAVRSWRHDGVPCWFTIDAGPNVHVIVPGDAAEDVAARARDELGLAAEDVVVAPPGGDARLVERHLA